jgi:hypothetical protein
MSTDATSLVLHLTPDVVALQHRDYLDGGQLCPPRFGDAILANYWAVPVGAARRAWPLRFLDKDLAARFVDVEPSLGTRSFRSSRRAFCRVVELRFGRHAARGCAALVLASRRPLFRRRSRAQFAVVRLAFFRGTLAANPETSRGFSAVFGPSIAILRVSLRVTTF